MSKLRKVFSRAALRGVCALLLLPAVALGGMARARTLYRCGYDGVARPICCCKAESATAAPLCATVEKACCCDLETDHAAAILLVTSRSGEQSGAPAAVTTPPVFVLALATSPVSLPPALDARIHGPPLILLKHSLLI